MVKTFSFPSVYESTIREYFTSNDPILGFAKIKVDGTDYLVGLQAFNEGTSPHKSINASPSDTDFKLISQSALLLAINVCNNNSKAVKFPKLAITAGFPFATFQINRDEATEYFKSEKIITFYRATESGHLETEQRLIPIDSVNIIPEVAGCDVAVRKGENAIDGNFLIVSLGYGTCEGSVSTPSGLLSRSMFSTHGISYAIEVFSQELLMNSFLRLKTEHQVDQLFSKGYAFIDRKRKDFSEEKKRALKNYYLNVVSPTINKFLTEEDFELISKVVLVGGGAYHQDLVNLFNEEFGETCTVTVFPSPERCASVGYAIHSRLMLNGPSQPEKDNLSYNFENESTAYVGIDIGNANTYVSVLE